MHLDFTILEDSLHKIAGGIKKRAVFLCCVASFYKFLSTVAHWYHLFILLGRSLNIYKPLFSTLVDVLIFLMTEFDEIANLS